MSERIADLAEELRLIQAEIFDLRTSLEAMQDEETKTWHVLRLLRLKESKKCPGE